jgi:emfourin
MQISVSRRGGFAGLDEELGRVRTEDLDPEEASALESRLAAADFFDLPSELPTSTVGADQFTYVLTVDGERGTHSVSYQDDGSGRQAAGPLAEIVDLVLTGRSA